MNDILMVDCPNCECELKARESTIGARATCARCGHIFSVAIPLAEEIQEPLLKPIPASAFAVPGRRAGWWSPGALLAILGIAVVLGGLAIGGPDAIGGMVFGVLAMASAAVMINRRAVRTAAAH